MGTVPGAVWRPGNPSEFKDLTGYGRVSIFDRSSLHQRPGVQLMRAWLNVQLCQVAGWRSVLRRQALQTTSFLSREGAAALTKYWKNRLSVIDIG